MANKRLFVDSPLRAAGALTLDAARSHYLCRVLRATTDMELSVFNGDGSDYAAMVTVADPNACKLALGDIVRQQAAPTLRLHLVQALIKRDRLDFVVQKATELGATDLWLAQTARTEVKIARSRLPNRLAHWRGVIESACEQCGRARLPLLHAPQSLPALLDTVPAEQWLLLDPGALPIDEPAPVDTAVVIGPEGGFSPGEHRRLHAAGAVSMGLGHCILRADTAPVAALAVLRQAWGWSAP